MSEWKRGNREPWAIRGKILWLCPMSPWPLPCWVRSLGRSKKWVIKRNFLFQKGDGTGNLPGSPFLRACRSLFPFAFIYLHCSTTYKSVTIALLVRIPCLGPWMGFFSIRRTLLNPLGSARRKISDWAYSSPDLQGYVRFFNTPTRDWGTRIILILFQAWSLIFNF